MQNTEQAQVDLVSLGEGSNGRIGLSGLTPEQIAQVRSDIGGYEIEPNDVWGCVDGRLPATAEKQVAGGLVITDAAAKLMSELPEGTTLSDLIGSEAEADRAAGLNITVHGDTHAGRAGCGANKLMRQVLLSNRANAAVVAPLAWSVMKLLDVDKYLRPENVSEAITIGGQHADNDRVWDVTPEDVTDLIEAHGGKYVTLEGEHTEAIVRVGLGHGGFDKARFVQDHNGVSAFALSLRDYADVTFERYGDDSPAAALHLLRATLFNLGVCKELGDSSLELAVVQPAQA